MAQFVFLGAGAGDDEMQRTGRKALSCEVERRDDAIDALLGRHATNVNQDEGVAVAVGGTQRLTATMRGKELCVDAASPDFDVVNADRGKVVPRDVRWRVDAPRPSVEFSEVARDRRPEPADAVRFRVAGEIGV